MELSMSTIPLHLQARPVSHPSPARRASPLIHSKWDAILITVAFLQGAMLLLLPSPLLIAIGMWWGANTIAHNFIHRPFFSSRVLNRLFSFYLTLILGLPQTLWRSRHLAHHADRQWKLRITPQLAIETLGLLAMWSLIASTSAKFFLTAYLPAYFAGLSFCWLQGRYEHVRGTTSHYGRLYNFLFFNDGYHVEHHARPGVHWHELANHPKLDDHPSPWPAVFRWLEGILTILERLVLHSKLLQQFVLNRHQNAFAKLLKQIPPPSSIGVVGGGLFPRSLLVLKKIYPHAQLIGIEANQNHIDIAKSFVDADFTNQWFDPANSNFDLLVIPLAYLGDKRALYKNPPAPAVLVHDWLWRKRGQSTIVSLLLLKRLNLIVK
jgi:hypothetical protein